MSFVVVAFLAGCGGPQLPIGAPGAVAQNYAFNSTAAHDKTFEYTGAEQWFKVPAGVTSIEVDALGAAGAGRHEGYIGIPGHGGRGNSTIPVKPGQTLRIFVGGSGSYPSRGFNGGGDGANRGPGATDVRDGDDLSDPAGFRRRAEAAVSVRLSGEAAPMAAAAAARKAAMGTAAPSLVVLAAPVREERKTKAEPVARLASPKKPAQAAREHREWAVTAGKVTQLATCLKAAAVAAAGITVAVVAAAQAL